MSLWKLCSEGQDQEAEMGYEWSPLPPISLGCSFPLGHGVPIRPFCILPLSSRPLYGSKDSVALRIGDLTIGCHRDHCDITSRGQVVQGGVESGNAWLELREIQDFCLFLMFRKGNVFGFGF